MDERDGDLRGRVWAVRRRVFDLSWPVMAAQTLRTLMRTTDIVVAQFPFNAVLLAFGTEVNAAYHIGRRTEQQIASPLSRGYATAANIIAGQSLGEGNPEKAYFDGWAATGLAAVFIALYVTIAGSLRGGSETVSPFFAKLSGTLIFLLGASYVFGLRLEFGVVAAYVAIVADYVWRTLIVGVVHYRRNWIDRGTEMMADRGSIED